MGTGKIFFLSAETTQYTADNGIDVNGILDAEGLASTTLRVQVKRKSSSIRNKDVLALRGALSQGEDGFKRVFLMEHAWYAVRINRKAIPFIKYLSIYQVAPVSKITYYSEVDGIKLYQDAGKDTGKYKIFLKSNTVKLENPVGLGTNPHHKPQGPKYAILNKILKAKTLDDVF